MYVEASSAFEAILESGQTGLVGVLAVKVIDNDGGTTVASTTANITELGTSGVYIWNAPASPASLGQYTIVWSTDGSYDADTVSTEELIVVASSVGVLPPIPAPDSALAVDGPCTAWLTGDDVAECCAAAVAEVGSMTSLLDDSADVASQLLYELSGRRWVGLCSRTVRPCHTSNCGCGSYQVLSRGHVVGEWESWDCDGRACGCRGLSRVRLSGHVRAVSEVKIDGTAVASSEYRVDEGRWLTRLNGERWPNCARLDLPDTEDGTFSVTYTYGVNPPAAGVEAAKQLACQIYLQCSGSGECDIPDGATRITRQGITIERGYFARDDKGVWKTGLSLVDYFLNTYNPNGLTRRALFVNPGSRGRHARPVG